MGICTSPKEYRRQVSFEAGAAPRGSHRVYNVCPYTYVSLFVLFASILLRPFFAKGVFGAFYSLGILGIILLKKKTILKKREGETEM